MQSLFVPHKSSQNAVLFGFAPITIPAIAPGDKLVGIGGEVGVVVATFISGNVKNELS